MIKREVIIQTFCKVIRCVKCNPLIESKLLRDDKENLPQPGFIGRNYEKYRLLLVGQNPGVCPPSMKNRDAIYMQSLLDLKNHPSDLAYEQLHQILIKFVPEWPVQKKYFPLHECGLGLEDIAYCNVVRCRTVENLNPSANLAQNCIDNHLISFIDTIEPEIIVCIGKWAYNKLVSSLKNKTIDITYMNRDRSLSNEKRVVNRNTVREKVLGVIQNKMQRV